MVQILDVLAPLVVLGACVIIVKIIFDSRIKQKLIEKGMIDEKLKYLYMKETTSRPMASVKWGLLMISIGIPLMLKQIFPDAFSDAGIAGLLFICAGISLFIYYAVAEKGKKEDKQKADE